MRVWGGAIVLACVVATAPALAQNAKDNCADASERGQKLVDEHRLLEARNAFLSCAQDSCPAAVRRDCQTQLDDVKKNIPSLVIRVKEKDGSDASSGSVSLDGAKIGVLDGQLLSVDPGTHKIHIELPDGRAFDRQVIVAAGEHSRAVTFDTTTPTPNVATPVEPASVKTQWTTVRTLGFVTTLVGGGTLVAAVATEILAFAFQSNATTLARGTSCQPSDPSDPFIFDPNCASAHSYHNEAISAQSTAFVLLGIGGGVLVTGLVMFFVGGSEPVHAARIHVTPLVGPTFAGLGLGGAF